ncbi:XRE family transcriptional regulator [Nonomuraea sp. NPDC050328]|uniref:XRE family transcriptional regulator n=1 Tax=Nonomuraea sp. NPDC050328 TaxID=3364361 RepID=UPI00379E15AD
MGGRPQNMFLETAFARGIRAKGLAEQLSLRQIADQIYQGGRERFGTTQMKAARLARGIKLRDVVEQIRAHFELAGRDTPGIGETLLSAYESGLKRPGPEYLHYLCTVYEADPEQLGYSSGCVCGAPTHARVVRPSAFEPPSARLLHEPPPAPSLRGGTTAAGSRWTAALHDMLLQILSGGHAGPEEVQQVVAAAAGIRDELDATLSATTISSTMVDHWEASLGSYSQQYLTEPPLRVLLDAVLDFSHLIPHLRNRQPIDVQIRLCRVAAHLAGLVGMLYINVGDHRQARTWFRTARLAADETGDRALRGWVLAREAFLPLYYGTPQEALSLAKQALNVAGQTGTASVLSAIIQARAGALLSTDRQTDQAAAVSHVKRAITRARAALACLRDSERGDPVFGYSEEQLLWHQGEAMARMGHAMEAELLLERALKRTTGRVLDLALTKLSLAWCRMLQESPADALSLVINALSDLPEQNRPYLVMLRGHELEQQLVRRGHGDHPDMATLRLLLCSPAETLHHRRDDCWRLRIVI